MEVWIDGVFKFKDEFKYGEHAVQAGHAYAEQFSHHDPVLRIDLSGA